MRVLPRRVKTADEHESLRAASVAGAEVRHRAMGESRTGPRQWRPPAHERQPRIPRDPAERDHHAQVWQGRDLRGEVPAAGEHLGRQRLVGGRGTASRRADEHPAQHESVVGRMRRRDVRQTRAVQRAHQEIAGAAAAVTGEHAAGAIGSVSRRRQPQDENARRRIAVARHRLAPVRVVTVGLASRFGDPCAVGAQPCAVAARDDGAAGPLKSRRTDSLRGWLR